MLLCSGKNTPFFKSLNKFGFLTLNNCADLIFNTFSTLKTMKMLGLRRTRKLHPFRVVTWYNGRFYVAELSFKPEVLTPNRNGFMAKTRYWHLKAGSTVYMFVDEKKI